MCISRQHFSIIRTFNKHHSTANTERLVLTNPFVAFVCCENAFCDLRRWQSVRVRCPLSACTQHTKTRWMHCHTTLSVRPTVVIIINNNSRVSTSNRVRSIINRRCASAPMKRTTFTTTTTTNSISMMIKWIRLALSLSLGIGRQCQKNNKTERLRQTPFVAVDIMVSMTMFGFESFRRRSGQSASWYRRTCIWKWFIMLTFFSVNISQSFCIVYAFVRHRILFLQLLFSYSLPWALALLYYICLLLSLWVDKHSNKCTIYILWF